MNLRTASMLAFASVLILGVSQVNAESINAKAILQLSEDNPCFIKDVNPSFKPILSSEVIFSKEFEKNPSDYQLVIRDGGMVTSLFGNTKYLPLKDIKSIEYIGADVQGWKRYEITPKVGKPIYNSLNFRFFEVCKISSLLEGQKPQCIEVISVHGTCTDGRNVQLVFNQGGEIGQRDINWAYLKKMTFLSDSEIEEVRQQHLEKEERAEAERQKKVERELAEARSASPVRPISGQVTSGGGMTPRAIIQQQMDAFKARVLEAKEVSVSREAFDYVKAVNQKAQQGFFGMCMKYGMPTGSVEVVAYVNKAGAATYIDVYPKTKLADCPSEMLNTVQFPRPPVSLYEDPGFPVHLQFNIAGN